MQSWWSRSLFLEAFILEPEVFVVESLWQLYGLLLVWKVNPIAPLPYVSDLLKAYLKVCTL